MSVGLNRGDCVCGRYEVRDLLGEGGMSRVWEALDIITGERVAIKVANPNVSMRDEKVDWIIRHEAALMRSLSHPAIPQVRDLVQWHGRPHLVMELVEGVTLAQALSEGGSFEESHVVRLGDSLCDVLDYLHAQSIVYRDMKPENVMLHEDGSISLVDFGISANVRADPDERELPEGTPGYSAPEQLKHLGRPAPSADVYALGTTLYTLVTGVTPQRCQHADGRDYYDFDLRPIRQRDPTLSEGLERVLVCATSMDPSKRYASVADMRGALLGYRRQSAEHEANANANSQGLAQAVVYIVVLIVVAFAVFLANSLADSWLAGGKATNAPAGSVWDAALGRLHVIVPIAIVLAAVVVCILVRKAISRHRTRDAEGACLIEVGGSATEQSPPAADATSGPHGSMHPNPSYAEASQYASAFVRGTGPNEHSLVRSELATLDVANEVRFRTRRSIIRKCSDEVIEWVSQDVHERDVRTVIRVRSS